MITTTTAVTLFPELLIRATGTRSRHSFLSEDRRQMQCIPVLLSYWYVFDIKLYTRRLHAKRAYIRKTRRHADVLQQARIRKRIGVTSEKRKKEK